MSCFRLNSARLLALSHAIVAAASSKLTGRVLDIEYVVETVVMTDYQLVGNAACWGTVVGGSHPTIKTWFPEGTALDCGDFCTRFRPVGEEFRGFTWYSQKHNFFMGECRCLFDVGTDLDLVQSTYAADASSVVVCESWQGTGEVTTNGVEEGAFCFKVGDTTQPPTSSSEPTSSPKPTTLSPTKSPSIAGGSPINGYQYGGEQCALYCEGCQYGRIDLQRVPNVETCAVECDKYRSIGTYEGFSFEKHKYVATLSSNACTCVFGQGGNIFDVAIEPSSFNVGGVASVWNGPQGYNDVPTYEAHCYQVDRANFGPTTPSPLANAEEWPSFSPTAAPSSGLNDGGSPDLPCEDCVSEPAEGEEGNSLAGPDISPPTKPVGSGTSTITTYGTEGPLEAMEEPSLVDEGATTLATVAAAPTTTSTIPSNDTQLDDTAEQPESGGTARAFEVLLHLAGIVMGMRLFDI